MASFRKHKIAKRFLVRQLTGRNDKAGDGMTAFLFLSPYFLTSPFFYSRPFLCYNQDMTFDKQIEERLVGQLLEGKRGAAREFYKLYNGAVKAYVVKKAQSIEDAEEIVQDTFLAAMDSLALFSGRSRLYTWMIGIARHEISDYYRKKRIKSLVLSQFPVLEQVLADERTLEDEYDSHDLKLRVEEVLEQLIPRYARVLRMKYLEGWSVQEIADKLGESFKATETALFRARAAFALAWVKAGG